MNHMTVDSPDAPWNLEELPEEEIEVTVSLTLSKTFKVKVEDYSIETDEKGYKIGLDFSECDLQGAIESQVVLPNNLAIYIERMFDHDLNLKAVGMPLYLKEAIKDCKDWNIDDIEVIHD